MTRYARTMLFCVMLAALIGSGFPLSAKTQSPSAQVLIRGFIKTHFAKGTRVSYVIVVKNYALALAVSPSAESGRALLFAKKGFWKAIAGGAGAFDVEQLETYGVPYTVARKLIEKADATP